MTTQPSLEPLIHSVEVNCSQVAAFDLWTRKPSSWWPMEDHTTFGLDAAAVIIEPGVSGRIYERNTSGSQRDWGRITGWNPPASLSFTWHIYGTASEATDVEISFESIGNERTLVRVVHSGWERLKERGAELRLGNKTGWTDLLAAYSTAINRQPDHEKPGSRSV